jgi:preprotein translocase subunit YajC
MNVNFLISAGTLMLILIVGLIYFTIQDKKEERRRSMHKKSV